jgi:hypothetical protein
LLNDRENILSALREKPLKVHEVMKRANVLNEESCQMARSTAVAAMKCWLLFLGEGSDEETPRFCVFALSASRKTAPIRLRPSPLRQSRRCEEGHSSIALYFTTGTKVPFPH